MVLHNWDDGGLGPTVMSGDEGEWLGLTRPS
jgi:hypothetical protein